MKSIRRTLSRTLAAALSAALLLAPFQRLQAAELAAPVPVSPRAADESGKEPSKAVALGRIALGFALTSGIKYALGGLGPAKLLPFLSTMSPAVGVPALLAFSMAEAAGSIAIFNAVAGIKKDDRQVMAFLLASAASALATPFLMPLGPLGATVVANAGRLILFNLIARKEGEKFSLSFESLTGLRPAEEADVEDVASATTEGLPPDYLWAKSPVTVDGSLAELQRMVNTTYDQLVSRKPQLSEDEFRRYASAKASLEKALSAATAAVAR